MELFFIYGDRCEKKTSGVKKSKWIQKISSVSSCLKALNNIDQHLTKIKFSALSFLHFCQSLGCLFMPLNFCCCLLVVSGNSNFKHVLSLYLTNTDSCVRFLKCCRLLCKETGFTGVMQGWILFLLLFTIKKEKLLSVEYLRLFLVIVSFSVAALQSSTQLFKLLLVRWRETQNNLTAIY